MKNKFGWMTTGSTINIGDDFQCIAARNFLAKEKDLTYIDRERMKEYDEQEVKMVLNGWYMHNPKMWPPSDKIHPLLTSIHISNTKQKNSNLVPAKLMLNKRGCEFLEKYSPVGCRDLFTYKLLKNKGIKCYFSGCLTLTLENHAEEKKSYICLVDPSERLVNFVKEHTNREIRIVYPEKDVWPRDYDKRIEKAHEILKIYAEAHMVLTSRLHGALPSLAMGTPVLLLEHGFGDERYEGLKYFVNFATYKDLYSNRYPIDFENPMLNPREHMVLRKNLEYIVSEFVNGDINQVDFEKIHKENMEAYQLARQRTISFYKKYKLENIKIREFKSNFRFFVRNIENFIKQ